MVDHAVDQETMFVGVDVGRLVTVRDHKMQRGGCDDPDRILGGSPEAEVAVVSRRRRIVQPHGAQAGRTLESGALAVSVQIFGARFGFFGPCILSARGLYRSNSQAG